MWKLSREQVGCRNIVAMLHVMSSEVRVPRPLSRVYEWYVKVLFTTKSSGLNVFYFFLKISLFRVINENNDLSPSTNVIIHEFAACHHFVINW